jgi:hypothetical protein
MNKFLPQSSWIFGHFDQGDHWDHTHPPARDENTGKKENVL